MARIDYFFNEIMMLMMMMTLALYYARTLSWIIIVPTQSLKHQPACRHIASLKPIIQTLVILCSYILMLGNYWVKQYILIL
jgi:hypothetical protein